MKAAAWGGFTALFMSPFIGYALADHGVPLVVGIAASAVVIFGIVTLGGNGLAHVVGEGVRSAVWGSRGLRGPGPGWSRVESLVARGEYAEALAEYKVLAERHPDVPEVGLRIGRLLSEQMGEYEEAVVWLRRARTTGTLAPQVDVQVGREIVGIYATKLRDPARALPELARMAELYKGTETAAWAAVELAAVKKTISA